MIFQGSTTLLMSDLKINRIKAVLAEKDKTSKWLSQELKKNKVTVSRWCRNVQQPPLETLWEIANLLDVHICELLLDNKSEGNNKSDN